MKALIKISSSLCLIAMLGACSTMDRLNPFSSAKLKPAELQSFKPQLNVQTVWSIDVGDSETGLFAPAEYTGVVYAASQKGEVFAIEKATGKLKWKTTLQNKLKAGVAIAVDTVAVVDSNNQLVALDFNGKQKWKSAIAADVITVPVAASGVIFVRPIDYSVMAFSPSTGSLVWKYQRQLPPLTLRVNSPVEINNARVYAGFPGGRIVGLDINNGVLVWEGLLASPTGTTEIERIADITGTPTYNFREVCGASFQGKVGCLDAVTGRPVWTSDFSAPNGASVDDRYLIASNELGDLFAFSRNAGKQVWRVENLERRSPTTPASVGRAVAVGDFEGYVHFIERDTGKTLARTRVGSGEMTSEPIAIEGGGLLVQSRKGALAFLSIQ